MKKTNETFIEEMNRINPAITFLDEYLVNAKNVKIYG